MGERELFDYVVLGFAATAAAVFVVLWFVTAPYGRHARSGWGPTLPNLWGWLLMEIPAPAGMAFWFVLGGRFDVAAVVFFLVWQVHYCQRTFLFPFLMKPGDPPMPLSIALSGLVFNVFNTYVNGRWLFWFSEVYPSSWITDPRFVAGAVLFATGLFINLHSDHLLRRLRGPGETEFKIPRGGLFEHVSGANYFGELIEWIGWAVMTWSIPTAVFAFWTLANLAPRARSTHRWYREKFPDYPRKRKALIPFLW